MIFSASADYLSTGHALEVTELRKFLAKHLSGKKHSKVNDQGDQYPWHKKWNQNTCNHNVVVLVYPTRLAFRSRPFFCGFRLPIIEYITSTIKQFILILKDTEFWIIFTIVHKFYLLAYCSIYLAFKTLAIDVVIIWHKQLPQNLLSKDMEDLILYLIFW